MEVFLKKLSEEFATPFHNPVLIFSTILFIILIVPLLLRKLRVPGIIGLILSGVAIGPYGFSLIQKDEAVVLFSQIGLLYIMFIAGLDLDLKEFKRYRNKSLLFGLLTFAIPLGIGLPVCMYLLGYNELTSLLVASMFATHTLVAYPVAARLGITRNEAVAIAVGGTILTDTAVLVLLAVITGRAQGGDTYDLLLRLGLSCLIFLAFMVFAVPALARWFFRRLGSEKNSQYIFVLSVVFFSAFFSEMAGLEPIIGAFAAGLALNNSIPHTSALMNRIDFVGNSLFIPFFLISVGMLVDVRVLGKGPTALIVAGVLTATALASKYLAAWLSGAFLKYRFAERNLMFGLSAAHAAATLAVITVGFQIGLVDENILNGTIILILVTCLVASFVTETAGRKVALREDQAGLPTRPGASERILVPIAKPETLEKLLDLAYAFKAPKSGMPVYCLSVVEDGEEAQAKLERSGKTLEHAKTHVAAFGGLIKTISTLDQNIATGIKRVAREVAASDIVMGSPDRSNLTDIFFGRMIEQVLEATNETVWVYHSMMPLNVHKKIDVVCPQHAEKDPGFAHWVVKVMRLAGSLGLNVVIHTSERTFAAIQAFMLRYKLTTSVSFIHFEDWEAFLEPSRELPIRSLVVVVMPREGSISHTPEVEQAGRKLAKRFNGYSYITLYPETRRGEEFGDYQSAYDPQLLEMAIQGVKRGSSWLGLNRLFRKKR